jgi:hypothetical protein
MTPLGPVTVDKIGHSEMTHSRRIDGASLRKRLFASTIKKVRRATRQVSFMGIAQIAKRKVRPANGGKPSMENVLIPAERST